VPDTRSDQSRCLGAEAPGARGAGGRGAGARRAHHLSVIGANQGPQAILLATDVCVSVDTLDSILLAVLLALVFITQAGV